MRHTNLQLLFRASKKFRNEEAVRQLAKLEDLKIPYIPSELPIFTKSNPTKVDRNKSYGFLMSILKI